MDANDNSLYGLSKLLKLLVFWTLDVFGAADALVDVFVDLFPEPLGV